MKSDFKAFYKSPWGKAFIAYFVAMGLVGALTPPDILTAYSWTRPFTDFMASIVPQIDKVTALGIDPDINRFYFSVMWAGSPVIFIISFLGVWEWINGDEYAAPSIFNTCKILGILVICALVCYRIEWATEAKSRLVTSSFGTNFGRITGPQSFVLGPVMPLAAVAAWVITWLRGCIPNSNRKQTELENTHGK